MADEMIELLPCPFCGGDEAKTTGRDNSWWVYCDTCGVEMMGGSPTRAARMWNRRATDAAPGEAELLRDALREYQDAFYNAVEGNRSGAVNDLLYEYFDVASKKAERALRDSE